MCVDEGSDVETGEFDGKRDLDSVLDELVGVRSNLMS